MVTSDADLVALDDIVKSSGSAGNDKLKADIALHGNLDKAMKTFITQKQTLEVDCALLDSLKHPLKNSCDTLATYELNLDNLLSVGFINFACENELDQ